MNLSFWATDSPITLDKLDDTASMLVKVSRIFKEIYIGQGATYKVFVHTALRSLSPVEINYRRVQQSIGKIVAAHSRVHDILYGNRDIVVAALSRIGTFGIDEANEVIRLCESRELRGSKSTGVEYPNEETYQFVADCANRREVFCQPISGSQLVAFRDGNLTTPLLARNMAHATYFFYLLAAMKLLPRNWKHQTLSKGLLLSSKSNQPPTMKYLNSIGQKHDARTYLGAVEPKFRVSYGNFYSAVAAEIKFAVLNT